MKRLFIVTLAVVIGFLTGIVSTASADSIQGKSAVGVNLMYVIPGDSDVSELSYSVPLDNAVGYGLTYTYGLHQNWAIEASIDRSSHNADVLGINFGEVSMTTMALTGQYRTEIASMNISPYTGLGLGYSLVSADLSSEWKDVCIFISDFPCSLDVDNAFTLHINAGADYFVNDNFAIAMEGRYTLGSASATYHEEYALLGPYDYDFDLSLDRFDLRVGVKYYF